MPRDAKWPFCQKFTWLGKWESFSLSHHSAKFDLYRCCGGGDKTFSFCHLTSRDSMIKRTCNLSYGNPLSQVITVPNFMLISFVEVEILICHMKSRDLMIKGTCDLGESWVTPLLSYVWKYFGSRHKIFNLSRDVI